MTGIWAEVTPQPHMVPATVQLFVNRAAGSASARRVALLRKALERRGAEIIITPTSTDPLTIADTATHVCAVGGDGTLRHVGSAIARSGRAVPMGLYPTGTINLLARECGYKCEPETFARRLLHGDLRTHYVGSVNDVPFFTCVSVGPDAQAVAQVSFALKRQVGRLAYGWSFLRLLGRWRQSQLHVIHDGGSQACEAVYVAKGRFFAGPWSFAPNAAATEPLLHVVTIQHANRRTYLRFMKALLLRRPITAIPGIRHFTATTLRVEGVGPIQADGDIVTQLPADIAIQPEPLHFA